MGWAKIDDQFYDHPKVQLVGNDGAGLYVKSLAYCCRHLTDGLVPTAWAQKEAAGDDGLAQRLVSAGLWTPTNGGPEGYRIPDFLEFNPSREDVLSRRDAGRTKKQRQRESQGDTTEDRVGTPGTGRGGGTGPGKGKGSGTSRAPASVDRKRVTKDEHELASQVFATFNEVAGSNLTSTDHLIPIIGRIREKPGLGVAEHRKIIAANFADPWWKGRPGVEVIYGSAVQFEKAFEKAKAPGFGQRPAGGSPASRADADIARLDAEAQRLRQEEAAAA